MTRAALLLAWLLLALVASVARGQASGAVERVGLDGYVRPDSWTPLLVRLRPETGATANYRLRVRQHDLDGDAVVYERTVPLTGNAGGRGRDQFYWTYFVPDPLGGGLASAAGGGQDVNARLVVTLETEGGEEVARVPVQNAPQDVDAGGGQRGRRLVVFVGGRSPTLGGYDAGAPAIEGVLEDVAPAVIAARDLPDDVRGYDAADAVVLLGDSVDYDDLLANGRLAAIREYVRRGGRLVILQPTAQFQQALRLGDLLPVTVRGIEEVGRPDALRALALGRNHDDPSAARRAWDGLAGPFRVAEALVGPRAVVAARATLDDGRTVPYLVRQVYGTGSVTWVAQELTDPSLRPAAAGAPVRSAAKPQAAGGEASSSGSDRSLPGWANVWNAVLGFADAPVLRPTQAEQRRYQTLGFGGKDLGQSLLNDMQLAGRTAGYVALSVVFFLGYWAVAGPGLHLFLVAKKRTGLSWYLFAATAIGATLLTVLVVRLVLRGPPEARHLTLVRAAAGESAGPAVAHARIGLYIPRDGPQTIALPGAADGTSTVTAFPLHPGHRREDPPVTGTEYVVPVVSAASDPAAVDVPYRSTLKRLAATWVGADDGKDVIGGISGRVTLRPGSGDFVAGVLSNDTGRELRNVYLAVRHPQAGGAATADVLVLYLRRWDRAAAIDLGALYGLDTARLPFLNPSQGDTPERRSRLRGRLSLDWVPYWYGGLRGGGFAGGMDAYSDFGAGVRASYPLLSFFGALPPMLNDAAEAQPTRSDLLRRGARAWDASAAVVGGGLVVLAESPGPLPFPLTVDGRRVAGDGTVVYQFVLPVDRSAVE